MPESRHGQLNRIPNSDVAAEEIYWLETPCLGRMTDLTVPVTLGHGPRPKGTNDPLLQLFSTACDPTERGWNPGSVTRLA
jgi:hypothetical protein